MKINTMKVAALAKLSLKRDEIEKFESQLSSILDYFKELEKVDVTKIPQTSQVTGLENVLREDQTEPSLSQKEALQNTHLQSPGATAGGGQAKSTEKGMFKVNAILEE